MKIIHEGYAKDSPVQDMVQYAYDIGWIDLVKLIECENWQRKPFAVGDNWNAHWLCQVNTLYHKLDNGFFEDWKVQINQCNRLLKQWVPFYWPTRIVKWQHCYSYVSDRFTFIE